MSKTCFMIGIVTEEKHTLYSRIPSVNNLLETDSAVQLKNLYSHDFIVSQIQMVLGQIRRDISNHLLSENDLTTRISNIESEIKGQISRFLTPSLHPIINATGVIVFTNAGRSPIAPEIARSAVETAESYTNLEYDLETGKRGHRDLHFESRMLGILNCEAATVCNNAAAALLLILNSLAFGKKVLVSRGELIEIGGSFRLPAIMEKSGAILKEVGTTNKTKPSDYLENIDSETAMILRVHPSNYQIIGFTQRPSVKEMAEVAHQAGIPLVHDLGSGLLFPPSQPYLQKEPVVETSLKEGSDLVCFSGDKLLGGPQAGLILGKVDLVQRIRKNPLMRAMRVDKIIYSVLERTLMEYAKGTFQENLPIWQFMNLTREQIEIRARRIVEQISIKGIQCELVDGNSLTGGGSAPEETIPTVLISIHRHTWSPNQLESHFRKWKPPILTRIEKDQLLLDLRTVFPHQDETIVKAINSMA
jgi:L-seryl-tRNA(Ser) seleniumtransferase